MSQLIHGRVQEAQQKSDQYAQWNQFIFYWNAFCSIKNNVWLLSSICAFVLLTVIIPTRSLVLKITYSICKMSIVI